MENKFLKAAQQKISGFFKFQNNQSLKRDLNNAATLFFIIVVFSVAITLLAHNSVDLMTIWARDSADGSARDENSLNQDYFRDIALDTTRAIRTGRAEATIYRNGKDASAGFLFPIFPVRGRVTDSYGARLNPFTYDTSEFHAGLDVGAPQGTPVFAAAKGTVTFAGWEGGYGNVVMIEHGGTRVSTRYAHLARIDVGVGTPVNGGTQIGLVGSTGRSTGPHLHFEVRVDGRTVNPLSVYSGR